MTPTERATKIVAEWDRREHGLAGLRAAIADEIRQAVMMENFYCSREAECYGGDAAGSISKRIRARVDQTKTPP